MEMFAGSLFACNKSPEVQVSMVYLLQLIWLPGELGPFLKCKSHTDGRLGLEGHGKQPSCPELPFFINWLASQFSTLLAIP